MLSGSGNSNDVRLNGEFVRPSSVRGNGRGEADWEDREKEKGDNTISSWIRFNNLSSLLDSFAHVILEKISL